VSSPNYADKYPWGEGTPDPTQVYLIDISLIGVPDLRVTSTFNPEQFAELLSSIKTEGQKDPVKLVWVNSGLVLSDGLNRIVALKQLSVGVVKALISPGTMADVQINNVITARHRGKENPGQTAEVIRDLIDNEKLDKHECQQRLGLTDTTFRRLYAISKLPPEVKDHLKYARLGVGAAYHLSQLQDAGQAILLASQAVAWGYSEDQVKAAVVQILNPDVDTSTQSYVFESNGRPTVVYPKCSGCGLELQSFVVPMNCCQECHDAITEFFKAYLASSGAAGARPSGSNVRPTPETGFVQES